MSLGAVLSLLKDIVSLIMKIPAWIDNIIRARVEADSKKRSEEVNKAVDEAKKAKTIEEKADAACKLTKALNPDSTCDTKPNGV